jgi:hypothetical protein
MLQPPEHESRRRSRRKWDGGVFEEPEPRISRRGSSSDFDLLGSGVFETDPQALRQGLDVGLGE